MSSSPRAQGQSLSEEALAPVPGGVWRDGCPLQSWVASSLLVSVPREGQVSENSEEKAELEQGSEVRKQVARELGQEQ